MLVLKLRKNDELKVYTPREKCTLEIQDLVVNNDTKYTQIKWNSQESKAVSINKPQTKFGIGDMKDYFIYFSILKITPSRIKLGIESSGQCLVYRKELDYAQIQAIS